MSKNAEFERFADFLARMIEKYGNEVNLEMTANKLDACIMNEKDDALDNKGTDTLERGCWCA